MLSPARRLLSSQHPRCVSPPAAVSRTFAFSRAANNRLTDWLTWLTRCSPPQQQSGQAWGPPVKRTAERRDERLKAAHKPYQLPDPSGLRLTRLQYDVDKYLSALRESAIRVSAFDMEWNMSFKSGIERRTGLIQIAHPQHGHLLYSLPRGSYADLPLSLKNYLKDETISKIGVNIGGDVRKLSRDFPASQLEFNNVFDLSDLAKRTDAERWAFVTHTIALQELAGEYLQAYLSKSARTSANWERLDLSMEAIQYAAGDTSASLDIYYALLQLAEERDIDLSEPGKKRPSSMLKGVQAHALMTPRQSEAWSRAFASGELNVESAAIAMGIKSSTVTRYLIAGLERHEEALKSLSASQIQEFVAALTECSPRVRRQHAPTIDRIVTHAMLSQGSAARA